ncbi:hypothetical protein [Haloferax sp. DFSO52]|uniref:hypothetical protein n=1 Tax=Haloferax sp. DFSO52 TaxID=3388505 RepID=UPI003A85A55A
MAKLLDTALSIKNNYNNRPWLYYHFAERVLAPIHNIVYSDSDGIDIVEEDWDNLLLLDACRYDLFEEVADISQFDSYSVVESKGSHTSEWTSKNFTPPAKDNLVYVNSSPEVSRNMGTSVTKFIEAWRTDFDPDKRTVPAENIADRARSAKEENPHCRLLVHFLQPHYPFINHPELQFTSFDSTEEWDISSNSEIGNVWDAVLEGVVSVEDCWKGYKDNLEYVLEIAIELANELPGKTVITSDHGNLIGEKPKFSPIKIYGHPKGIHHEHLRKVPWAVIDSDRSSNRLDQDQKEDSTDIQEQLKALGYTK